MFTLLSNVREECILYGCPACGSKRRLSTMKSSSIAPDDDDDVDEERGARKTDTPIYNALKSTMRVICVRLTHTARIHAYPLSRGPDILADRFALIVSDGNLKPLRKPIENETPIFASVIRLFIKATNVKLKRGSNGLKIR